MSNYSRTLDTNLNGVNYCHYKQFIMTRRVYKSLQTKAKIPLSYRRRPLKKPQLKEIPPRRRKYPNTRTNYKIKPKKFIETSLDDNKILEEEIDRNDGL